MHWNRIIKNIFSSWSSYLLTAVIGFLLTPVVVHALGPTGYGLWTLVLSITGYFGLLDLGIRSSVSRFLTRHFERNDQAGVNRIASTAVALLACGSVLGLFGTAVMATVAFDAFRVEPQYQSAGRIALLITGLNISFILPAGIFSAILYASERFDIVSAVTIVLEVTRAAVVVWLLNNGFGLVALAIAALLVTATQYGALAVFAKRQHPELQIALRHVDRSAGRELMGFSIYRFIWIIANQLIFYSDAVVIGIYLGAGAITHFAIASSLIVYGRQFVFLLLDPFYPSAARMDAKGDIAELRRLLIMGTRIALLVALPLCLGFVFLGRQFITLWMGTEYADSARILAVLALAQLVTLPQYVSTMVLSGMARHRPFAYVALAEGVANLALSAYLVQRMGIMGIAWGTVIPALITNIVIVPAYTLRVLDMSARDYLVQGFVRPVACAVPVAVVAYGFSDLQATSWLQFVGQGAVIGGALAILSYFICLYAEQRAAVTSWVLAFLGRTPAANRV